MGAEQIAYGYDGSLVTSETVSGTLSGSLTYGYNNDFNLTSFTYAGATATLGYDDDGLLTSSGNFTISRNAANGLPEAVTGGGLALSRTFNGYGEMDGQAASVGGQAVGSWTLTRDNTGRITGKTETVGGSSSTYSYSYDSVGRLRTVTKDGALVEEYRYNSVGTRIYDMNALRGISGRSMSYSAEDHLLSAGGATYQYDVDGYLTTKTQGGSLTTYAYSSRGESLRVVLPDGKVIEYMHDPLGRRIAKKINGTITEKYLWQGMTRLLAVYDGSDSLVMRFEYADGRMPVAMTTGGATFYLAYEQVGSLRVVADSSGAVVKRVDYDSFGNIIGDTNASFTVPFGFAGGLYDRDTGLVRFGFRDYDPDVGRWTAKEPIGFGGGDPNLYGYVWNDPVNLIDPNGNLAHAFVAGGVAGLVSGGIVLATELAKGKDLGDAAKAAFIAGVTTGFSTGFATLGGGFGLYLVNSMLTTYVNASFQAMVYGCADFGAAVASGFVLPPGGILANQFSLQPAVAGILSGFISGPTNVGIGALSAVP